MPSDVSSLLEVSIAFNFAYALIRGLSSYEIRGREKKADQYLKIAGDLSFENDGLNIEDAKEQYKYYALAVRGARERVEDSSKKVIIYCCLVGVVDILVLFIISFNLWTISDLLSAIICIISISSPFLAAIILWACSNRLLKEADQHLNELRKLVIPE